jgi:hypothetical protein
MLLCESSGQSCNSPQFGRRQREGVGNYVVPTLAAAEPAPIRLFANDKPVSSPGDVVRLSNVGAEKARIFDAFERELSRIAGTVQFKAALVPMAKRVASVRTLMMTLNMTLADLQPLDTSTVRETAAPAPTEALPSNEDFAKITEALRTAGRNGLTAAELYAKCKTHDEQLDEAVAAGLLRYDGKRYHLAHQTQH